MSEPLRVLLIEDNPADASLIRGQLQFSLETPMVVTARETLAKGLHDLETHGADVILLDLQLPDATGLEAITPLRSAAPDVPIVVLTGNSNDKVAVDALAAGCQDFLVKGDYEAAVLLRSIRYARERATMESRNRQSDAQYRNLLDQIPVGVFSSTLEGRVVEANPRAAQLLGFGSVQELLGKNTDKLYVNGKDRLVHLVNCRKNGGTASNDLEIRGPNGTIWVRQTSRIEIKPSDSKQLLHSTIQDITAELAREQAERKARENADEIARLEQFSHERTRLLRTAAHELNTPLMPLQWELHAIRSGKLGPVSEKQEESLEILDRNLRRLALLVQDVLDVNRLQAGHFAINPGQMDLGSVVDEAVKSVRMAAQEMGIEFTANSGSWPMVGDPARLIQAVLNLLRNALHYTPAGGSIKLKVATTENGLEIAIRDTGIGISAEGLERLFVPFGRVHDQQQIDPPGSGLGLFIARGIAEEHGGTLEAKSLGLGRGSTFTITLPLPKPDL